MLIKASQPFRGINSLSRVYFARLGTLSAQRGVALVAGFGERTFRFSGSFRNKRISFCAGQYAPHGRVGRVSTPG